MPKKVCRAVNVHFSATFTSDKHGLHSGPSFRVNEQAYDSSKASGGCSFSRNKPECRHTRIGGRAASTRNILIGGAAAAAGTLLIINHNKQVHQRYADDARRQADAQAQASNAQAAYSAERRAFENEVVLNHEYQHEVATQRKVIASLRIQIAQARVRGNAARVEPPASTSWPRIVATAVRMLPSAPTRTHVAVASWGWGQL